MTRAIASKAIQEVSSVHSTKRKSFERNSRLYAPFGKEQIHRKKLDPSYVAGFIDGEGSFSVSIGKHKTLKRGLEVRPEFEIELRADDREILERILITIGCGKIYDLSYERYGWYPLLDRHPLQAKKAGVYRLFREIVLMVSRKEHLSDDGFKRITALRDEIRKRGKKAKTYGNR